MEPSAGRGLLVCAVDLAAIELPHCGHDVSDVEDAETCGSDR